MNENEPPREGGKINENTSKIGSALRKKVNELNLLITCLKKEIEILKAENLALKNNIVKENKKSKENNKNL